MRASHGQIRSVVKTCEQKCVVSLSPAERPQVHRISRCCSDGRSNQCIGTDDYYVGPIASGGLSTLGSVAERPCRSDGPLAPAFTQAGNSGAPGRLRGTVFNRPRLLKEPRKHHAIDKLRRTLFPCLLKVDGPHSTCLRQPWSTCRRKEASYPLERPMKPKLGDDIECLGLS